MQSALKECPPTKWLGHRPHTLKSPPFLSWGEKGLQNRPELGVCDLKQVPLGQLGKPPTPCMTRMRDE